MKIDRLLSIIFILLKNKRITAKELSDKFEVSERTIYRDLNTLDIAGIPIISFQGKDGGYGIVESYRINESFFKKEEASTVVDILKSLSNIFEEINIDNIINNASIIESKSNIKFDFSHWGNDLEIKEKINLINSAIKHQHKIEFNYYNSSGDITYRKVSPIKLILKSSNWYLHGFCHLKNDERVFKIIRIEKLIKLQEKIEITINSNNQNYYDIFNKRDFETDNQVSLVLKFDISTYFYAKELFSEKNIIDKNDNHFYVKVSYPEDNWVYSMILSFGEKVEVIEPKYIRNIIVEKVNKIINLYS